MNARERTNAGPSSMLTLLLAISIVGCERTPATEQSASQPAAAQFSTTDSPDGLADSVHKFLLNAPTFEFRILNPTPVEDGFRDRADFHGVQTMGRALITDDATRREVLDALYGAIDESDGTIMRCFSPRHGIRATDDERTVDLVICFECWSMHVHEGEEMTVIPITDSPRGTLERVREALDLPLPKQ